MEINMTETHTGMVIDIYSWNASLLHHCKGSQVF